MDRTSRTRHDGSSARRRCDVCDSPLVVYGGRLLGTPPRKDLEGLVEWTFECVECGKKWIERFRDDDRTT